MWHLMYSLIILTVSGDGQVDFNEFMTILGPKLLSSETREGFLGNTIDTIFWQVNHLFAQLISSSLAGGIQAVGTCDRAVKTTQHLLPERSCEWWRCCVTVTDVSPYTRKADKRYQRCRTRMRANVRPLRWKRLTARRDDERADSGGSANGNDGRSSRCEGGNGTLGSDRNSQRACPLHASSARSEVVVGGRSMRSTMRGGKPRSGEQIHEYLMGCVDHIYWSVISEHASQFLH